MHNMSEELVELINEALSELPPDLPSHVRTDKEPGLGPGIFSLRVPEWNDAKDLDRLQDWIGVRIRPVLVTLGRDRAAAQILAEMLPKPRLPRIDHRKILSQIPGDQREEYERVCLEKLDQERDELKADRDNLRIKQKELQKRRAEANPESVNQVEQELTKVGKVLTRCESDLEERRRKLNDEEPLLPAAGTPPDWSPPALQEAYEKAEEKAQKEWEDVFFGESVTWIWMLWDSWERITHLAAIPGLPKWPGADRLRNTGGLGGSTSPFLGEIRRSLGVHINASPGRAAHCLQSGLEDLREQLLAPRENDEEDAPELPPSRRRAHQVWAAAVHVNRSLEDESDRETLRWLKNEGGLNQLKKSELVSPEYELPKKSETWLRYIREARASLGQTSADTSQGSSPIIRQDQVEADWKTKYHSNWNE